MKWKLKFIRGQEVEVASTNEGLEDSFFLATIISISNQKRKKNKFLVEYKNLVDETDETKPLRENLPYKCLRPVPPKETTTSPPYELNEEVDAFYNDGWWKGVITKIPNVDSSKYSVFFKTHNEEREFEFSDLRSHLDWIDVNWVSSKNKETAVLEQYGGSFLIPIPTGCSACDSDMDISSTPPSEMMDLPLTRSNETCLLSQSQVPVLKENGGTFLNRIPTSSSVCGDDMGILQLLNGRMDNLFTANKIYVSSKADTAIVLHDDETVQSHNLKHMSSLNTHMANQQTSSGGRENLWEDVLSISREISERMETSNNTDTPTDAIDSHQENMQQSASKSDTDFYGPFKNVWKEGADADLSRPYKKVWKRGATIGQSLIKACRAKGTVTTDALDIFSFPAESHDVSLTTRKGKRNVMEAENSKVIGFPNPHVPTGHMKEPLCSTEVKGKSYQRGNVLERKRGSTGEKGKRRRTKTLLPIQTQGIQPVNQLKPDDAIPFTNASIQSLVSPQSSNIVKSLFPEDSTTIDDHHQYDCARREESVDLTINTLSSPMQQDEMPFLLQDRSSLFVKNPIFWERIESDAVFQLIPQQPHFDPLKQYDEEFREGLALGKMVNYVKLVEMTLKATPDDPRHMFENFLKALTDMEKHGFTVQPIRSRLKELLSIKDSYTKLNDSSKIAEREFIERQKRITQMKIELRTLTMEVEEEGSRVVELQKTLDEINKSIQIARLDFRSKVASPLVST